MDREALKAQVMANAQAARESLGQDTIDRLAAIMKQKENSVTEQAKAKILSNDLDRIALELSLMIEDDREGVTQH